MKMIMFNAEFFWFKTFSKTIENVEDINKEDRIENAAVVFIHVESDDEARKNKVIKNAVGNLKWISIK